MRTLTSTQKDTHEHPFYKRTLIKILTTSRVSNYAQRILELQHWFVIKSTPEQQTIVRLIKDIRKRTRIGMGNHEVYQVYITAKNTSKIPGAIAEVGVFEGGSALLINEAKGPRKLYLFDTFSGLPSVVNIDSTQFHKGQFPSDYAAVSRLFTDTNVLVSKGIFPQETGHLVKDERFSFVHLDVDIYNTTKDCLEFFYPRMSKGGVILSHDYTTAPGVRKAFDDFFKDKPEIILEPSRSQALVVKL